MPSVYDFHHIEINGIGRGKKRVSLASADGGIKSVLKSPPPPRTTAEFLSGDSPTSQRSLASTPNSSRPASRRGSRCEDTKNRLFGPAESSPRKVKNLFQSKIFDTVDAASPKVTKIAATKAVATFTPVRRNPITGEVCAIQSPSRSNSVLLKKALPTAVNNGNNASASLPVTPTFNRTTIATMNGSSTNSSNLSNSSIASSCLSINSSSSAPSSN